MGGADRSVMTTPGSRYVRSMVVLLEAQAHEIQALQRALRGLQCRLDLLLELDGMVADQLAGPLAVIERSVEGLRSQASEPAPRVLADQALAALRSANGVVGQLGDPHPVVTAPLQRAGLVTVPVDGLVEQALRAVSRCLDRALVELDLPEGLMITTAPRRVVIILANLLENAAARGGPAPITCRAEASEAWLCIEVADRGPGLDGMDAEAVFQPPADDDGDDGARPGLYVVRMLARSLGGDATVADRLGGGSVVTVRLPRRRRDDHAPRRRPGRSGQHG